MRPWRVWDCRRFLVAARLGPLAKAGPQTGAVTLELLLLTPLLLAMLSFVVGLGRAADARGQLTGAVRDAARAASLAGGPQAAEAAAQQTAAADLTGAGLACQQLTVRTDTSQLRPGGQVTVRLSCQLNLADLMVSGLPGQRALTATATVPLARFSPVAP